MSDKQLQNFFLRVYDSGRSKKDLNRGLEVWNIFLDEAEHRKTEAIGVLKLESNGYVRAIEKRLSHEYPLVYPDDATLEILKLRRRIAELEEQLKPVRVW